MDSVRRVKHKGSVEILMEKKQDGGGDQERVDIISTKDNNNIRDGLADVGEINTIYLDYHPIDGDGKGDHTTYMSQLNLNQLN